MGKKLNNCLAFWTEILSNLANVGLFVIGLVGVFITIGPDVRKSVADTRKQNVAAVTKASLTDKKQIELSSEELKKLKHYFKSQGYSEKEIEGGINQALGEIRGAGSLIIFDEEKR